MTSFQNQSTRLMTMIFRRRSKPSKKKRDSNNKKIKNQVLGGVYHVEDEHFTMGGLVSIKESKNESSRSLSTMDSTIREEDDSLGSSWTSSGSPSHHQGAPLLVRSAVSQRHLDERIELSDEELLGRIMLRARKLPKTNTGYFVSNHVMINNERTRRTRAPLKRNPTLDEAARQHARDMATQENLVHPELSDLPNTAKRLGANVGRGTSVGAIHKAMLASEPDKNNMIDRRFVSMGVGTAKSADGTLYLCQIFGG